MIVDAHNDLLLLVDRRPPVEQAEYFRERWLPQLRAGGVAVQVRRRSQPTFVPCRG